MSNVQTSHYCATCQHQTLHTKPRINHVLHLILSVLTAGIWLPVWAILGLSNSGKRTLCTVCGSKPGIASVKHNVAHALGHTHPADETPPSTWLPPGAQPPVR